MIPYPRDRRSALLCLGSLLVAPLMSGCTNPFYVPTGQERLGCTQWAATLGLAAEERARENIQVALDAGLPVTDEMVASEIREQARRFQDVLGAFDLEIEFREILVKDRRLNLIRSECVVNGESLNVDVRFYKEDDFLT